MILQALGNVTQVPATRLNKYTLAHAVSVALEMAFALRLPSHDLKFWQCTAQLNSYVPALALILDSSVQHTPRL